AALKVPAKPLVPPRALVALVCESRLRMTSEMLGDGLRCGTNLLGCGRPEAFGFEPGVRLRPLCGEDEEASCGTCIQLGCLAIGVGLFAGIGGGMDVGAEGWGRAVGGRLRRKCRRRGRRGRILRRRQAARLAADAAE